MKTVGIVLAAGRSKRFGQEDKLLAKYKGRPLCSYAANAMRGCGVDKKVACVRNPLVARCFQDFDILHCQGKQSDSLKAGLRHARQLGAFRIIITLADMPQITSRILNRLINCQTRLSACKTSGGQFSVPACFSKEHFFSLQRLKGDQGARQLLASSRIIETIKISNFEAIDIDVASDLKSALSG